MKAVSLTGWELFLSQNLRVPTDVTPSGEAKSDCHTQQELQCESKESVLFRSHRLQNGSMFPPSHWWKKKYSQWFGCLADPPRCFHFSTPENTAQVNTGWSSAGIYVRPPNWEKRWKRQPIAGATDVKTYTATQRQNKLNHRSGWNRRV